MTDIKKEYIKLPLRLKTKEGPLGRLQNIFFIASGVMATTARYYWHGPEVESWSLRFHIIKNILRRYLTESLPHGTPNELSEKIDFNQIADYIDMNNLPSRALQPNIGHNKEFDIVPTTDDCMPYDLNKYGLSGDKLNRLASQDLKLVQDGDPRTISCQVVVGSKASFCKTCKGQGGIQNQSKLLAPEPLSPDERIILHLHGGAYCVGDRSLTHLYVYASMSSTTGLRVFSPNYRLAPRSCFPSQLHDCFLAYKDILRRGFKPKNLVLSGDSAGGSLAVSLMFILREKDIPMPSSVILVSPWVDSTCSGDSWHTNQGLDYLPSFPLEDPFHPTRMFYAAGRRFSKEMHEELKCPLVSPIFGDLGGLPPMLIQMGRNELLHDDIYDFAVKAQEQSDRGKESVVLQVFENMPHAFILIDFTEAAQEAFTNMNKFLCHIFGSQD